VTASGFKKEREGD